jgi:hypothetical protein
MPMGDDERRVPMTENERRISKSGDKRRVPMPEYPSHDSYSKFTVMPPPPLRIYCVIV